MHRMATGHYNEIAEPRAGASMTPFGRNTPGYAPGCRREMIPDPFLVAQKLLARRLSGPNGDYFKPAGAQLNILAAAWIQAMVVSFKALVEGFCGRGKYMLWRGVGGGRSALVL